MQTHYNCYVTSTVKVTCQHHLTHSHTLINLGSYSLPIVGKSVYFDLQSQFILAYFRCLGGQLRRGRARSDTQIY